MSTATTIIEGMVMEGKLDAGEAPVLIAGHFTGELNAVEVILDPTGVFNGQINARRVELSGNFNGKLITEELTVGWANCALCTKAKYSRSHLAGTSGPTEASEQLAFT